jgi:hypothetical protein
MRSTYCLHAIGGRVSVFHVSLGCDKRGQRRGVGAHGLFEEAVEQQAAAAGYAAVEPEGEVVEVVAEMVVAEPLVEGSFEPALEERRDGVDAVEGDVGGDV